MFEGFCPMKECAEFFSNILVFRSEATILVDAWQSLV